MNNPFEELTVRLDRLEELILSSNSKPDALDTLNLSQASKLCQISVSMMYDLSRRQIIPSSRIGNRYVFIKADLLNWLRTQTKN